MAASSNPSQHSYMRSLIARDLLLEEWQLVERSGAIVPPGLKGDYLEGDCLVSLYCLSVFTTELIVFGWGTCSVTCSTPINETLL